MQIEHLKVFCDLVENESFTTAAQINQIGVSAVSQQLTFLERLFNAVLLERTPNKEFRITPEGQVVYEISRQILQSYDLLHSQIQKAKSTSWSNLRVATTDSIGLHDLPPCIETLLKTHPTVKVHVEFRSHHQVFEDVLASSVDLGVVAYPEKRDKLKAVPLWKDELVLICHPQNPLANRKSIRLAAVAGQRFITFDPEIPARKAIDKLLREHSVTVQGVMECNNVETVKQAVEIDAGISIVPAATIVQEIANKTLAAVQFQDVNFIQPTGAIYKKNRILSPAMKQFLAILRA